MQGLKQLLIKEYERSNKILEMGHNRLQDAPEGTLRVSTNGNSIQFYHGNGISKRGEYIPKEKEMLIHQLAQKGYDQRVVQLVEKRLRYLEGLIRSYDDNDVEELFLKEHPAKRSYIIPHEPTWDQLLQAWKSKPYIGKGFAEDMPVIMTERGERVRSKSEKIMADYFYRHGIEYKYECPLYLKGFGPVYPDFTFLSPKTYKEIYWEHNGRMDDPVYSKNAVRKICTYENNGIYPGENLILTFETEQMILNTAQIEQMVRKYLVAD